MEDGWLESEKVCFFFNDTATTEIYTLSLHDALPI